MNNKPLALKSHIDNIENQCIIHLCTNYCYCINIGSDISPPTVLYLLIPILVKITISVADILADLIIGTTLVFVETVAII